MRPLANPFRDQLDVVWGQRLAEFVRRHPDVRVIAGDPLDDRALLRVAGDGVRSLTRQKNTSSAGSNAADFALAPATACNNANQCATLGPAPTPTPGKAERACRRALRKAGTAFAATYGTLLVGCETQRLKGKLAGACPDAKTLTKIAAADAKRTKAITKACGALPLPMTGFDATCPAFTGGCGDALASVEVIDAAYDAMWRAAWVPIDSGLSRSYALA